MTKTIIRKAIENKKHWVAEIYFDNKNYPNIISGRYKTKKDLQKAIFEYESKDKMLWGNI